MGIQVGKILFEDLPSTTTPINSNNLNNMQNNMEQAIKEIDQNIQEFNLYSTEETLTGETWIDGKPIYRKVINTNSPSQTLTQQIVGTLGSGLNELISLKGMIDIGEYGIVPIPQTFDSENINNLWLEGYSSGNIICIVSVTNYTNTNLKIIAKYTKTTN